MDLDQDNINAIGSRLTRRIAQALSQGEISAVVSSEMSTFILEKIDSVKTHQELVMFLTELSQKWPLFSDYLTVEKGRANTFDDSKKKEAILQQLEEEKQQPIATQ